MGTRPKSKLNEHMTFYSMLMAMSDVLIGDNVLLFADMPVEPIILSCAISHLKTIDRL
jgi:hypothetical protein